MVGFGGGPGFEGCAADGAVGLRDELCAFREMVLDADGEGRVGEVAEFEFAFGVGGGFCAVGISLCWVAVVGPSPDTGVGQGVAGGGVSGGASDDVAGFEGDR